MKLYAPKYYTDFVCIADRCRHSCCVGWEIDVDNETAKKYAALVGGYGEEIKASIDLTDTPHFRLAEGERCPHLNREGLCKIILALGEDYLCEICREHPRFYNRTPNAMEVGLGMACEEAARIILGSDSYTETTELGEVEGEPDDRSEIDTVAERERIYSILSNKALPYSERLGQIGDRYSVSPDMLSDSEWCELLGSLEYLDVAHRSLFSSYSSNVIAPSVTESYLERALAYFIFRHCTECPSREEHRAALGLCLFFERLLASVAVARGVGDADGIAELARIISEELEYSKENTDMIRAEFLFG